MSHFKDLGLSPTRLACLQKQGFTTPTPIQQKSIPLILTSKDDVVAKANTGTGKTAAFGLPILDLIDNNSTKTQVCVLVPTRELAIQVSKALQTFLAGEKCSIVTVYGGQSMSMQIKALKKSATIVVGTPGRVMDHLRRQTLDLQSVAHFVLDEADEMLNMGFVEDIETILAQTNAQRRIYLFSATMPKRMQSLIKRYLSKHVFIEVQATKSSLASIDQYFYEVNIRNKLSCLLRIIKMQKSFYGVVFAQTRKEVDEVVVQLKANGYYAQAIHGDIQQRQREQVLNQFRQGKCKILVATDVAARGIDVQGLNTVINYSLGQSPESYVHRIGRTGRAGQKGVAISLVMNNQMRSWSFIQRINKLQVTKRKIPSEQDVQDYQKKQMLADLDSYMKSDVDCKSFKTVAGKLLSENSPTHVVSALLSYLADTEVGSLA